MLSNERYESAISKTFLSIKGLKGWTGVDTHKHIPREWDVERCHFDLDQCFSTDFAHGREQKCALCAGL